MNCVLRRYRVIQNFIWRKMKFLARSFLHNKFSFFQFVFEGNRFFTRWWSNRIWWLPVSISTGFTHFTHFISFRLVFEIVRSRSLKDQVFLITTSLFERVLLLSGWLQLFNSKAFWLPWSELSLLNEHLGIWRINWRLSDEIGICNVSVTFLNILYECFCLVF